MIKATAQAAIVLALLVTVSTRARGQGAKVSPVAQVSVVRAKESTPQRVVLLVQVEGKGMALGSYEGRLRFDPATFVVDSATPGTDGSRFVNAGGAAKGEVRFAGFTPTGFKSTDALRIVGRAPRALDAARITAVLEVAGDLDGKALPKAALLGGGVTTQK